jgi:hypothetical protein
MHQDAPSAQLRRKKLTISRAESSVLAGSRSLCLGFSGLKKIRFNIDQIETPLIWGFAYRGFGVTCPSGDSAARNLILAHYSLQVQRFPT